MPLERVALRCSLWSILNTILLALRSLPSDICAVIIRIMRHFRLGTSRLFFQTVSSEKALDMTIPRQLNIHLIGDKTRRPTLL